MKIIAIIEKPITSGGGFNQALNAIQQMSRLSVDKFDFSVVTPAKENIDFLKRLNIKTDYVAITFFDKILSRLFPGRIWGQILAKLKIVGPFEKQLIKKNCDLVYFVEQSSRSECLQNLNFIETVHDLCHQDQLEFPEVRTFGEFRSRELVFQNTLKCAFIVMADSEELADKINSRYGVDRDRIVTMPFSPSPFLKEPQVSNSVNILKLYKLDYGYFFYPAQFWAHKNHYRIIEAVKLLHQEGTQCRVVFVGGDKGNYAFLDRIIRGYGLSNHIQSLGFIPAEHMMALYENCQAVIMPTYFGSTNLPPLEAWLLGKPLIYSNLFSEQSGNAALLIDPDNANSIANAMKSMMDESISKKYIKKGYERIKEISSIRKISEKKLFAKLLQFEQKRQCWE
jgi:glycosyltransferase involved in cell wall biosynthesis